MHRAIPRTPVFALFAGLAGCGSNPNAPDGFGGPLPRSSDMVAGIEVTVMADRATAALGDTITFAAAVTNRGNTRVQVGLNCGPSLDVVLAAREGLELSVLHTFVQSNGGAPCPSTEEHFADPGETETLHLKWRASARGTFTARAGLRRSAGIGNLSMPITVVVR